MCKIGSNIMFKVLLCLVSMVLCGEVEGVHKDLFAKASLRIQPGRYEEDIPSEFKEWMLSEQESDTRFTQYVEVEHVDDIPNPQLVFVN